MKYSGGMESVKVCETFVSIQGESSYAGLTCFFIRLSGCNLRCKYCDTPYAYSGGEDVTVPALVEACRGSGAALVEVTGGEPLLQAGFPALAGALRDSCARPVLVETSGSCDISLVPEGIVTIMDVKCPGSGESASLDVRNLSRLRRQDQVKFVLSDRLDYEWARSFVERHRLLSSCREVIFGPVSGILSAKDLAAWMIEDRLTVRLQVPLHKILGMK